MESITKLSNFNFQWAKNLVQEQYQNNFIYLFLYFYTCCMSPTLVPVICSIST